MAQNVKVCCRFRPANRQERAENSTSCITCDDTSVNIIMPETNSQEKHSFNFDRVFDTDSTQISVFEKTAQPLVKDVFEGYNTTIFAYGQTGSGKTFTMMGDSKEDRLKGIIPRLAEAIFNGIEEAEVGTEFTVKLSYVEIYNEKIRDLLNPRLADNLKIREGSQGVWIQDVTETYVGSFDQVLEIMQQGSMNRAQASTNMNLESSRSHSVFILTLGQLNQQTGTKKGAKLTLVDLAGSEKVRKTGAAGAVLEEAKHINKSLSALGNVINALTSNAAHIPYRDSKLTRLLSDSLGGNCRTCLIITCSPMSTNAEETLSTLRFGIRAKTIKNMAKVNQEQSVSEYKRLLALAEKKIGAQGAIILALEHDLATLADYLASCDQNILPKPIPVLSGRGGASAASAPTSSSPATTSVADTDTSTDTSTSSHSDDDTPDHKSSESSSTLPVASPTHARTSSTDHISASALALANIDLEGRVQELDRTNQFLRVQLQDKEKELEEQLESITSDKAKMEQELDSERRRREEAELKAQHMKDTMQEYAMLKKKMELMEKEHTLSIMQLKEESYQLKMKLADLQTNTGAAAAAGAGGADKDKEATTSTSSSSRKSLMQRLTGTPGATDRQPSPSPSRSPPSTPGQTSPPSRADATSPATSAAVAAAVASSSPASAPSAGQQNKVDTLIAALQRKCDQYIQLQMAHQNQAEHLAMVEFALEEATQKMRDAQEEPQKKIRALEEKLLAAENLCTRLLESGRYWQKERNKQTRAQQKIVVPLQGGGKKHGTNTSTTPNTTSVMKTSDSMDVFF